MVAATLFSWPAHLASATAQGEWQTLSDAIVEQSPRYIQRRVGY